MRTNDEEHLLSRNAVPGQLVERLAGRVGAERREQRLLLELLVHELVQLDVGNRQALGRLERDAVTFYEAMRATLSPEDKDAFLRAILDDVRGIADQKRSELRAIIRRHIHCVVEGRT